MVFLAAEEQRVVWTIHVVMSMRLGGGWAWLLLILPRDAMLYPTEVQAEILELAHTVQVAVWQCMPRVPQLVMVCSYSVQLSRAHGSAARVVLPANWQASISVRQIERTKTIPVPAPVAPRACRQLLQPRAL